MGVFNTRPRFDDIQIKQLSGDTITLSGTTNISGTFRYIPGATVGYVLRAIDSNGTVGWQPVSVSGNTYWELGDGGLNSLKSIYNNHFISSTGSIIGGGDSNYISGGTNENNFIIGGENNSVDGSTGFNLQSGILGGTNNKIFGRVRDSVILGGRENQLSDVYCGVLGGRNNSITQEDSVIMGGRNNRVSGFRGAVIAGQNITGTTDDTVYVPNLTVREDHILHSDSTLEVVDIPGSFENAIKGSYTEFNWDGITTNILSNSNPSGSTSFLLGNFATYPTILNHGFLSYYGTGYTRTGTPTTGVNFYRNKMVLKTAGDSEGTVFSNANPSGLWYWESDGNSRMKLTERGFLGLGLNTNGIQNPSEMLHVNGGDILVENTNGEFFTDIQNSAGVNVNISAGTNSQLSRITISDVDSGIALGHRGNSEPTFTGYGKQGDGFLYSGNEENGLNIISQPGTGTDDYIRFFVGQAAGASGTPDLYIQGSGTTRGNVGINTDSPSEKLHVNGSIRIVDGTEQNGYVLTSDANGVGSWSSGFTQIKEVFFKPTFGPGNRFLKGNYYPYYTDGGTDPVYIQGSIPFDMNTIISSEVLTIPEFTATEPTDLGISYAGVGQVFSATTLSSTPSISYTSNQIKSIDTLNIFSGTSSNDVFGFNIFQNNTKLFVIGLKIKYSTQ